MALWFDKKAKIIVLLSLFSLYWISNWMMDIMSLAKIDKVCAINGLWSMCNQDLWYHVFWYANMGITFIFVIWLGRGLYEQN